VSHKIQAGKDFRIPESSAFAGLWKVFAGVGLAGLAAAAYGWVSDAERFAFSYLFAFFLFLTFGFGGLFFVLVERLTGAYWSVVVRRTAEFFMSGLPVFAVLFIPIIFVMGHLFPWLAHHSGGEHGAPAEHAALAIIPEAHAQPAEHGGAAGHADHAGAAANPAEGHGSPSHATPAAAGGHEAVHGGSADPHELEEEELLEKKSPYLNKTAFLIRALVYFILWTWVSLRFFGLSTSQDTSKDPKLTLAAQRFAPAATPIFGLTLTFAAFDWLMSLNPTWYSTIFGVTIFAGSVVAIFATLIVVTMSLREQGMLKDVLKIEHFHDMGKLLFGFMVFWAYVNFSQLMLIWYAGIPEELTYFHLRWDVGPWKSIAIAIVTLHFVVPFFTILSRNAKRRLPILRIGATILIAMHCVEMYWIVLPNYRGGSASLSWMDIACFLGIGGIYLAAVFQRMSKHPLIPIGDPRLARSLHHEIENA
jgi:hypothetical protein